MRLMPLGARYKGQAVGAGNYSDMTDFQFSSGKDDYYWRRWNGVNQLKNLKRQNVKGSNSWGS